jgi:hypothetical protein
MTSPGAHWHCPETHAPVPQLMLHWPQWVGSFERSAQALLHSTVPWGQGPHCPERHCWPVLHASLQAPQWVGSLARSKQPSFVQETRPLAQTQTLPTHVAPGPQTVSPQGVPAPDPPVPVPPEAPLPAEPPFVFGSEPQP